MGWVRRRFVLALILFLAGCTSAAGRVEKAIRWEQDDQLVRLTQLAQAHLGKQLGVPDTAIRVQRVVPFVCPGSVPADTSRDSMPGKARAYTITLLSGNLSHTYHAKTNGSYLILWYERETLAALPGGQLSLAGD